jgi:hypothetical protein
MLCKNFSFSFLEGCMVQEMLDFTYLHVEVGRRISMLPDHSWFVGTAHGILFISLPPKHTSCHLLTSWLIMESKLVKLPKWVGLRFSKHANVLTLCISCACYWPLFDKSHFPSTLSDGPLHTLTGPIWIYPELKYTKVLHKG